MSYAFLAYVLPCISVWQHEVLLQIHCNSNAIHSTPQHILLHAGTLQSTQFTCVNTACLFSTARNYTHTLTNQAANPCHNKIKCSQHAYTARSTQKTQTTLRVWRVVCES